MKILQIRVSLKQTRSDQSLSGIRDTLSAAHVRSTLKSLQKAEALTTLLNTIEGPMRVISGVASSGTSVVIV